MLWYFKINIILNTFWAWNSCARSNISIITTRTSIATVIGRRHSWSRCTAYKVRWWIVRKQRFKYIYSLYISTFIFSLYKIFLPHVGFIDVSNLQDMPSEYCHPEVHISGHGIWSHFVCWIQPLFCPTSDPP